VNALIGNTGFVGSNLALFGNFDKEYNSKTINSAFDYDFDLIIYAGVRAEKYLAAQNPENDFGLIHEAIENLKKLSTKKLVLISTIDVYKNPNLVDEDTIIDTFNLHPYGLHRYYLEQWVRENFTKPLIIRLPALYGINIKKNFIFDMVNLIPSMLSGNIINKIHQENPQINIFQFYKNQNNGFYSLRPLEKHQFKYLRSFFTNYHFNALSFTDSRNKYQFYPLSCLWKHIQIALDHSLDLVCLNSEPVTASELYQVINKKIFTNEILEKPIYYDIRSKFANLFYGEYGYCFKKEYIIKDIVYFVTSLIRKEIL